MIYHVINANMFHQVPNIIRYTLQYAPQTNIGGVKEHFFFLTTWSKVSYLSEMKETYDGYKQIFSDFNSANYCFVNSSGSFLKKFAKIDISDRLIVHGGTTIFGKWDFLWLLFLLRGKRFCKRIVLIVWNGVMIEFKQNRNLINILRNIIKKKIFTNLGYIITLSPADEKRVRQLYPEGNVVTSNTIMDHYTVFNRFKKPSDRKAKIRIMVSHSAFEHNHHLKTFSLLARFASHDIQVICPLSYGNKEYQERVVQKGKEIFGDKFIYYQNLLPLDEYYALLGTLDIFIANCDIQSGLHVVWFGLCTGLKMYLTGNNLNHVEKMGFTVNRVSDLANVSYENLIRPISYPVMIKNKKLAKELFGPDEKIQTWREIFGSPV